MAITVLLSLLLISDSTTAKITTAPTLSDLPTLYTLVNFTCDGTGNTLIWTINDHSLTNGIKQYREISITTTNNISVGVLSSVLTIRALPINDGIHVGCLVFGESFDSKGTTLRVKGIASIATENLYFNFSLNSSSWLTWSHPFQSYPLSYHIYIVNQHDQLLYNDITEDTSYELYNLTVCDIYTATVIVHSGEYGSNSTSIQRIYSEETYAIIQPEHSVIFNKQKIVSVHFNVTVEGFPKLCNSTLLGITRDNSHGTEEKHALSDIVYSSEDKESVTVNYNTPNIGPQLNCVFIADIMDSFGHVKTTNESYFTTYHVQGLTPQCCSDNGSVVVECRFAERSTADGCHVIFRESSKGTVKSINISKSSIEESTVYQYITLPVSGNYTVTAHDIVDGTIITNPSVVYPQVLEYILLLPSPTETIIFTSTISYESVSDFTSNTTSVMASVEPTSGIYVDSIYINFIFVVIGVLLIIITCIAVIIVFSCIIQRRKKKQVISLSEEGAVTYYPQTNKKSYKDSAQLTNAIPTYNFSPHEAPQICCLPSLDKTQPSCQYVIGVNEYHSCSGDIDATIAQPTPPGSSLISSTSTVQSGANVQEAFEETVESEIDSSVIEDEDLMLKEEKIPPTDNIDIIPEPTAMTECLQQLSFGGAIESGNYKSLHDNTILSGNCEDNNDVSISDDDQETSNNDSKSDNSPIDHCQPCPITDDNITPEANIGLCGSANSDCQTNEVVQEITFEYDTISDTDQTTSMISVISQNTQSAKETKSTSHYVQYSDIRPALDIKAPRISQPSLNTQSSCLACQHPIIVNGCHSYIEDDDDDPNGQSLPYDYNWKTPKEIKHHSQYITALKSDGIGTCEAIPFTNHQLPPKDIVHNKYDTTGSSSEFYYYSSDIPSNSEIAGPIVKAKVQADYIVQNSDGSRAVLVTSMCSDDVVCCYDFVQSKTTPCNTNSYYYQDIEDVTEICDQDYETYSELYEEMVISSVNLPPIFVKSCLVSNFKFLVDNEINICCSNEFDVKNDNSSDGDVDDVGKIYLEQKKRLNKNSCQKIGPGPEESKFNGVIEWTTAFANENTSKKEYLKKVHASSEKSQPSIIEEYKATSRSEVHIFVILDYICHPLSNLMVSCRNCLSAVT